MKGGCPHRAETAKLTHEEAHRGVKWFHWRVRWEMVSQKPGAREEPGEQGPPCQGTAIRGPQGTPPSAPREEVLAFGTHLPQEVTLQPLALDCARSPGEASRGQMGRGGGQEREQWGGEKWGEIQPDGFSCGRCV